MQRWIIVGVLVAILGLGGSAFGLWSYKQSRPHPMYVPIPLKEEVPPEDRKKIATELKSRLEDPALLLRVSKDLNLTAEWELPSDEAAVEALKSKLIVDSVEGDISANRPPTLNVGLKGKKREKEFTTKAVDRLMTEVWPILGLNPPAKN